MAIVLHKPINNAQSTLRSSHAVNDGVLTVNNVAIFGTPSVDNPVRVTVSRQSDKAYAIYSITNSNPTTNALTIGGLLEGTTDISFSINDPVSVEITAGTIQEVHDAINNIDVPSLTAGISANTSAIVNKANDTSVVHLSGSETVTGLKEFDAGINSNGVIVRNNMSVDPCAFMVSPPSVDATNPVTLNHTIASYPNDGLGATTLGTYDHVYEIGFNCNQATGLVTGFPVFRDAWENKWWNGTGWQFERHVGAVIDPGNLQETRPITMTIQWADMKKVDLTFNTSSVLMYDKLGRTWTQSTTDSASTNPNITHQWLHPDSGYPIFTIGTSTSTNDNVNIGYPNSGITTLLQVFGNLITYGTNSATQFVANQLQVNSNSSTTATMIAQGSTGQEGNLHEWQDVHGNVVVAVNGSAAGLGSLNVSGIAGNPGVINIYSNGYTHSGSLTMDIYGDLLLSNNGGPLYFTSQSAHYFRNSSYTTVGTFANGISSLLVNAATYNTIGLVVAGAPSQTGDLQQWQDSNSNILTSVTANGALQLTTTISDANAPINSLFRGSDHSNSLCWKNSAGAVTVIAP